MVTPFHGGEFKGAQDALDSKCCLHIRVFFACQAPRQWGVEFHDFVVARLTLVSLIKPVE